MILPAVRGDDHLGIYRDRLLSRRDSGMVHGGPSAARPDGPGRAGGQVSAVRPSTMG